MPRSWQKWLSPPTRREISIVLFSLTIFIFSYNLPISLSPHNALYRRLGLASSNVIGKDGRRPPGWRDRLEDVIFGEWRWDQGHVSGDGAERSMEKGGNRYGAQWLERRTSVEVNGPVYGEDRASDAIDRWEENVPRTTLVKHVPGYTILDGLILLNRSVYIITDDPSSFPPLSSIIAPRTGFDIRILSSTEAPFTLGTYGGKIIGTTLLSNDPTPHNSTLISLWRLYTTLDPSITSTGQTILPVPRRLFLPSIPVFSDARRDPDNPSYIRTRSPTGFHPYLIKAAFPGLGVMYQADWNDYQTMEAPFIFERVVLSDRGAAVSAGMAETEPVFAQPFEKLSTSEYWLEPIRRSLAQHLGLEDEFEGMKKKKKQKTVITYLSNQADTSGLRLRDADHKGLVSALNKMGRKNGYEVNVVEEGTSWDRRMSAIVRSTVVLGVHSPHLTDAVFVKPNEKTTTLFEIFPDGTFKRDNQLLAHSIGSAYLAWWNNKDATMSASTSHPPTDSAEIEVNAQALTDAIRDTLRR